MPTISAGDLALLRQQHRAKFFLTPCPATVLWSAQVAGSHTRESVSIAFDGGAGANFGAITAGMELWIGTSAGAYDVDRLRIKSVSSGDSGVTGTVTVADNSVVWVDNQHLTFVGWFLIKPRRPDIGDDGTFFKDGGPSTGGVTYSDQNSEPTPVCIAGENRADFLDPDTGTWVIASQLPSSYAIADGATISSYGASLVYGPDTPVISINSGTGVGTITFDTAGLYWIAYQVTDSNGKSQVTYRWYYAHSTNPQSPHYPFTRFSINNVQGQWNNGGWSAGINAHGDVTLATIPDHSPCIVWCENWYGSTKKNITFLPDESNTVINGYVRRDKFGQDIEKGAHVADFSITTIQGSGDNKYNFSVSLEAAQTVNTWWKYPSWITPTRAVHHFFKWHSTLLEVADVVGLNANTDGDSHVEFTDGSLFEKANEALAVIRSRLVCDVGGRVHFVEDVQLRPDSERSGLTQVQEIDDLDKNGSIEFIREQERRVPFVYLAAFDYDGGFDGDGNPAVEARCAIAPGNNPYDDGPQPATEGKQIVTSQEHANQIVGRFLHAENNEYPEIMVPMVGRLGVLPIHLSEFWELTTLSGDTARKVTRTLNLILRQVSVAINVAQGTMACMATFEAEANGPAGIAKACPSYPDLEITDFEIPDADSELGGALMTGSSINYLPPQSKSWVERNAEAVQDAYADPHWRIKQDSFASADAIIWRCGTGYIKRSTNAGQTWSDVTPGDLPTGIVFIRGEGNYVVDEEHVFLGTWEDTGEWFSRLYITGDDGATWAEQDVASGDGGEDQFYLMHNQLLAGPAGRLYMHSIREIASDTFVVFGATSTSPNIKGIAVAGVVAGDVITPSNVVQSSISSTIYAAAGDVLSSSRIVLVTRSASATEIATYSYVGGSLALIEADTSSLSTDKLDGVCGLSATKFLIFFTNVNGTDNDHKVVVVDLDSDGTNITLGTPTTYHTSPIAGGNPDKAWLKRSSTSVEFYYPDGTDLLGATITVSGSSASVGSTATVLSSIGANTAQLWVDAIDGSKTLLGYKISGATSGFVVVVQSFMPQGTAVEYTDRTGHTKMQLSVKPGGVEAAICYEATASGPGFRRVITISGDSLSVGEEFDFPSIDLIPGILWLSGGALVGHMREDNGTKGIVFATNAGSPNVKGLGMSISKGAGEIVYVTGWDGTGLVLMIYTLPGLVLVDNIFLGEATEGEVDARTWIARPHAPFGDDMVCYVYGRMDNPLATGTVHILLTEDEALSFSEVEAGWGTNFCGSVIEDYGRIMAIRNLASSSKLYTGDVGGTLKVASTLPFAAQVNPQAMIFDWAFGALYVGSAGAGDVMVVVSPEPDFRKWYDMTFDHDNTSGIRSIITL